MAASSMHICRRNRAASSPASSSTRPAAAGKKKAQRTGDTDQRSTGTVPAWHIAQQRTVQRPAKPSPAPCCATPRQAAKASAGTMQRRCNATAAPAGAGRRAMGFSAVGAWRRGGRRYGEHYRRPAQAVGAQAQRSAAWRSARPHGPTLHVGCFAQ